MYNCWQQKLKLFVRKLTNIQAFITKKGSNQKIDFMFPCVYAIIDHRRRQNVVKT